MAVDVIFKRGLVHVVADHRAEGADAVTLLVLIQFVLGDAGEALAAVTTHQRLKWRRQHIRGRNGIASGLSFKSASKINLNSRVTRGRGAFLINAFWRGEMPRESLCGSFS